MAAVGRLIVVLAGSGLALWGLALGAESQREVVLESDPDEGFSSTGAAGNIIVLTAILVALGAATALATLSRLPVPRRLLPAGAAFLGVYGATLLGQTMWPYYVAILEQRQAVLSNSLFAANLPGLPSLLLPAMALQLATVLAVGWATRRLLGRPRPTSTTPLDGEAWMRRQAGATLLAFPFLALTAVGTGRLLLALPGNQPRLGPAFVVLPAILLACLALGALAALKTWHLGTMLRDARLAAAAHESWTTLGRLEAACAGLLGAFALAGSFLPGLRMPELALGRVLELTLRSHTQLAALALVAVLPALLLQRPVLAFLARTPLDGRTTGEPHPTAILVAAAGLASLALAFASGLLQDALWAWLLAIVPCAAVAASRCGTYAAPLLLLASWTLWGLGNTVQATYDGSQGAGVLAYHTAPGLLALMRTLGAVVAAATVAVVARPLRSGRGSLPLAAGTGAALAAIALLEMPLTAWVATRTGIDAIAVGSVVASLDPPVRAIVHTVCAVLAVTAGLLAALLVRPDWFEGKPRAPVAVVRPKRSAAARPIG